jgi:SAM-dependent methyltransferase
MGALAGAAFDRIAEEYDEIWTRSTIGQLQRSAVWRHVDPLVKAGDRLLDIGCGTGEDALHFMQCGAEVQGIDASLNMVRIARARGVQTRQLAIEAVCELAGTFDGAISNFGALNCVRDLTTVASALGCLIRPGGYLAICVMGACCAWEIIHFLRRGTFQNAFRRWRRENVRSTIGVPVSYRSVNELCEVFRPQFEAIQWYGVGIWVPPSYVHLSEAALRFAGKIDGHISDWPLVRALSDHRLILFERL